tara:strand:+ start:1368 stop:2525 length:1158 start_codon:yes stop_codon:yes gene_type:complete
MTYNILFIFLAYFAISNTFLQAKSTKTAAGHPVEGKLEAFLGEPKIELKKIINGNRFPNVVVAVDGSVLAVWNGVVVKRSEDGGDTWGPEISVGKGFMGGGVTVNERNGEIFAFVEKHHPPADVTVYKSKDSGKSWKPLKVEIKPDSKGNAPSMHMNDHGITLRHGKHAGRLIRATRWYAGQNNRSKWPDHYTNAIYSDDGGKTWQTSEPFPANGTGEAAIAELSDGRVYYNSRRHWAEKGANPLRRWTAWSDDGGATWKDLSICEVLPDGPQNTQYGCMAGLTRLPIEGRDILLYSNCDSPGGRKLGTVWVSFDGGKSWPVKRLAANGGFAYSSMTSGRPGTKTEGWVYLNFEAGGSWMTRFNLSWLLKGKKTGDGEVPDWVSQ